MSFLKSGKVALRAYLERRMGFSPSVQSSHLGFWGRFRWEQINQLCSELTDNLKMSGYSHKRVDSVKQNPPKLINYSSARLLSCLQHVLLQKNSSELRILDFGGGFGNHYFQLRNKLNVENLVWNVCETEHMVRSATPNFSNNELKFITSSDLNNDKKYDILICSCSIHYLENPFETLAILVPEANFVLLDRLPLIQEFENRLSIQRVEEQFYRGLHPWWFLSQSKFNDFKHKQKLEEIFYWSVPEDRILLDGTEMEFSGYFFKR